MAVDRKIHSATVADGIDPQLVQGLQQQAGQLEKTIMEIAEQGLKLEKEARELFKNEHMTCLHSEVQK
eukprot:10318931-Karenia_brevis.AAC.1